MQRLNKTQKVDFFQIPNFDINLMKLSLESNGKTPCQEWKTLNAPIKSLVYDNCNVGLITGIRNMITVVDLDFKDIPYDDHAFIEKFGNKFMKHFDTFTVKTQSGGYHLYFKYDAEIKQTQNKALGVDIRNDGGYVVCPPSSINGKQYVIKNNVPIKPFPSDLKKWILSNLYQAPSKSKKSIKDKHEQENKLTKTAYDVIMTREIMLDVLSRLKVDCAKEKDFRGSYNLWIQVLCACKFCGMQKEFIEWSKDTIHGNYDNGQLLKIWNDADATIHNFIYLLKCAKVTNNYTFKRIPDNGFTGYTEINKTKLGNIFKPRLNYLLKSDTGTGKTTSFRNYIKRVDTPFISIASRIALSLEQYNNLKDEGVECYHYQDRGFEFGDNIIITPESCISLMSYDFSNYIIFMDEFDSIVKHVLTSDTLSKKRCIVFKLLCKMLFTCKQFICVDADISSVSKSLLDKLELKYSFIINIFKNYQNVNVNVINDEDEFFRLLSEREKYMMCTDSKTTAEIAHLKLNIDVKDVLIITSDSVDDYYMLDEHLKIIFSPKIIYGLDSTMKRDVFCYFNGNTISPTQMVQQIARCRNIVNVYVFFSNRISRLPYYEDLDDANNHYSQMITNYNMDIKDIIDSSLFDNDKNAVLEKIFSDIYIQNSYHDDCFESNKYLHLMNILQSRGFIIHDTDGEHKTVKHKKEKEQILEEKLENFNPESLKVSKLNEYMRIPLNKIDEYKDIFIDNVALTKHINVCKFFFQDSNDNLITLSKKLDFDITKCKDIALKVKLLDQMLDAINLNKNDLSTFVPENKKLDDIDKIQKTYTDLFKVRKKNLDLSIDTNMYKEICSIYNSLFNVTSCKQTRFNGTRLWLYTVDESILNYHKDVYSYRKKKVLKKIT
jgi:hypothetical protein